VAELVGVDDTTCQIFLTQSFLEEQGHKARGMSYIKIKKVHFWISLFKYKLDFVSITPGLKIVSKHFLN